MDIKSKNNEISNSLYANILFFLITIIPAIIMKLQFDNLIIYRNTEFDWLDMDNLLVYIAILAGVVIILSLVIPIKMNKYIIGFKWIYKIPIEILFVTFSVMVGIYGATFNVNFVFSNNEIGFSDKAYLLYIAYFFGIFYLTSIATLILKQILHVGIREYVRTRSIIFWISRFIFKKIKILYQVAMDCDFTKEINKNILMLVALNAVAVLFISFIWILIIPYTLVLFVLIMKKLDEVIINYNKVVNEAEKIASGNLDSVTKENLGVFNPIKEQLTNIEVGFKKAVEEEVKSQKMKTELITNVSHDLKTPLTSIITYVDLLKDSNLDEDKRVEYLDILDRKSQRLQVLIEDLFEVSKANSGNINLNIVEVDVVALMKQTIVELEDKIQAANLDIKTTFTNPKIVLALDSQRIYRVFENLIINITKYAMIGSRVYIDIIESDGKVKIEFKNMSKDEITFSVDEIVERFVRGDKSRNTEGSGIGLALSKTFVELQKGTFKVSVDGDLFKVSIGFEI